MKSLLRLVRLPNTLTAAADVAAGAALAGATDAPAVVAAAGCSALLYGGGVALGDVVDLEKDRRLHPGRPLPSGAVTRPGALRLALVLLILGTAPPAWFGVHQALASLALLLAIVGYDLLGDRLPALGVLLMAACRVLNLLRGLALGEPAPGTLWIACAAQGLLVLVIALASRLEEGPARPRLLQTLALLGCLPFLSPALLALLDQSLLLAAGLALAGSALGLRTAAAAFAADPRPGTFVARGVFGITPLDALWAAAAACWTASLCILALVPLARVLGRTLGQHGS